MTDWTPITDETPLPENLPGPARDGWRLQVTRGDRLFMYAHCTGIRWDDVIAYRFIQVDMTPYEPPQRIRGRLRSRLRECMVDAIEWREGDVDPDAAIAAREFGEDTIMDAKKGEVHWRPRLIHMVRILNREAE